MNTKEQLSRMAPPRFQAAQTSPEPPTLPSRWQCTAILHPYSPPPTGPVIESPFFQLCVATIGYVEGVVMSVQITGLSGGTWWYKIQPDATYLSTDKGKTWSAVDMGWTLPTTRWLQENATYFSTGYLNWMQAQQVDWWKQPVPKGPATTWLWFNSGNASAGLPFRLMFGAPPPSPDKGDPKQLALFQNFSFTYFPSFEATESPVVDHWSPPVIPGFVAGNPSDYKLVVWREHFAMTTYMTPVDSASFPLPTVVLYQWLPDSAYRTLTDRAQSTLMSFEYNPQSKIQAQQALLFGVAPKGVAPPPNSGGGFLFTRNDSGTGSWITFDFGEEPPNWARIPAVQGTIHACVTNNPALCPNQTVTICSVLFPPSDEYPQGRYLWTWYSPFPGSDGTHSRPVTFMESASTIAEGGTSLALADYFDYVELQQPIDPELFEIPLVCRGPLDPTRKVG